MLGCIEAIELLAHRNSSIDLYAIFGAKVQPPSDEVERIFTTLRKGTSFPNII